MAGTHLHEPRSAGSFVPGWPHASAGELTERQLRHAPTMRLEDTLSRESLEVAATPKRADSQPTPSPVEPDNQTTPFDERQVNPDAHFTIRFSAGWEYVLDAALHNMGGPHTDFVIEDKFGQSYPLNCEGKLVRMPSGADVFPLSLLSAPPPEEVEPGAPLESTPHETVENEKEKGVDDVGREDSHIDKSPALVVAPPAPGVNTGGGGHPPSVPPGGDMYADGSYWKNLGVKLVFQLFCQQGVYLLIKKNHQSTCKISKHLNGPACFAVPRLRMKRYADSAAKGKVQASPEIGKLWGTQAGRSSLENEHFNHFKRWKVSSGNLGFLWYMVMGVLKVPNCMIFFVNMARWNR